MSPVLFIVQMNTKVTLPLHNLNFLALEVQGWQWSMLVPAKVYQQLFVQYWSEGSSAGTSPKSPESVLWFLSSQWWGWLPPSHQRTLARNSWWSCRRKLRHRWWKGTVPEPSTADNPIWHSPEFPHTVVGLWGSARSICQGDGPHVCSSLSFKIVGRMVGKTLGNNKRCQRLMTASWTPTAGW